MNLESYRGKMGRLIDAGSLLKAIDGSGRDMRLPNLVVAVEGCVTLNLADIFTTKGQSVEVANEAIATAKLNDNSLIITGISEGQTLLTLICEDGTTHNSTITVRKETNDNGWL